jgi:ATP-dependent protease ClpP protease subunit
MNMRKYAEEPAAIVQATSDVATKLTVEQIDNHIYFYSDVDSDRCLALIKTLRQVDTQLRNERASRNIPNGHPPTPIWLHIYSFGGDLFAGLSMADQMRSLQSPVYSVVEGMCCSAATLISMSCSRRYILPSSFMLIHQFSAIMWGTHEQFKDEMKLQEAALEALVRFYVTRSKVKAKIVRAMLKRDTWRGAATALEQGFVDEVMS